MALALVALPIGNSLDLSQRARNALEGAELLLCEDTRRFGDLAKRAGLQIQGKLLSMPSFKERAGLDSKLSEALRSQQVVLISDAGTPTLNDPGAVLVASARKMGDIKVTAIPGPSAPICAFQWSGGAFGLPLIFAGFTPTKKLSEFFRPLDGHGSFIFFDTKHRVMETLDFLIQEKMQDRPAVLAREMTKEHEEYFEGSVLQLKEHLQEKFQAEASKIGELTLIVQRIPKQEDASEENIELCRLLRSGGAKEASKAMSQLTGMPQRDCYKEINQWKN